MKLFIDQYGNKHWAKNITELRGRLGGKCSKMYVDRNGKTYHVGYVLGSAWLTQYEVVEKCVS